MRRILLLDDREIRLLNTPAEHGVFRFIEINSQEQAVRLLTQYTLTAHGLFQLRMTLAEEGVGHDPFRLTDGQVIDEMAGRIVGRRVRIARDVRVDELWFVPQEEPPQQQSSSPPAPPPRPKRLTWIELQFLDDRTGKPVNNLRIVLRTPDGNESFETTDADGVIRVDPVDPGTCDAWCEVKGATRENTLAYVGDGHPPKVTAADPAASGPAIRNFARVERHKVKTGESLDSLAKNAGMTWQDLAKFNWNTAAPDEINKKLRDEVGCTKKTKDGQNYVFDDTDKPGIVFIPAKWERTGLATGARHVFRGRALRRFFVILENDEQLRIPETAWEATLADGSTVEGTLGPGGVDAIEDPPEGEVEVFFPDVDDIEAKSLAASARKAFDDRDPTELHRLFRYPSETIRRAIEMYDTYFNTYHKRGLRADIGREFSSDPGAEKVFFGYLAHLDAPPPPPESDSADPFAFAME